MKILDTLLNGVKLVELVRIEDERGFFARSFCREEFKSAGLDVCVAQCNVSYNRKRGTVRGMHFQRDPYGEAKLVRCTNGAIYDVIADLRPSSLTYLRWIAFELSSENRLALYVPPGCAHGFQTLNDGSEVLYQMSQVYAPSAAGGIRWNDPALHISWPLPIENISEKDRSYPDLVLCPTRT